MSAKNLYRTNEEGTYSHIYNRGVEKRIIFNDGEDYKVFQGYLKDYLSAPQDPENTKKDFTVHGRSFRGTPHQPKNYFNKVELIAYSLMPDHFHLLLHQKTHGSLENFIRSLCTRYSMYFNKKYQHTGTLFEGPYKSAQIKDELHLSHLTCFFHHIGDYSSYPEYLGQRKTSWVKSQVVLSFFKKGVGEYKDFVEKYGLDQKEKELIYGISFDSDTEHLERRGLTRNEELHPDQDLKPHSGIPEFLSVSSAIFLLLVTLGIGNITLSKVKGSQPLPSPAVLAEIVKSEEKTKVTLTIKINDGAESVNIHQEPITNSEKIGQANDGDTFEFVSKVSDWYEIKFDESTGFISAKYILEETNK